MKNQRDAERYRLKCDLFVVLWTTVSMCIIALSAPLVSSKPVDAPPNVSVSTRESGELVNDGAGIHTITNPCGLAVVICKPRRNTPDAQKRTQEPLSARGKDKGQVFKKVCSELKIEAKNCWKTLYAMHMVETGGNCKAIGDHGQSRGCFQIKVALHKVSIEKAEDLYESAKWTLQRMISFNYPQFYSYAVRRHNGWGKGTLTYLARVNEVKERIK